MAKHMEGFYLRFKIKFVKNFIEVFCEFSRAPLLNLCKAFLVEANNSTGIYLMTQENHRNAYHTAHRNACQIPLDEYFLERTFSP